MAITLLPPEFGEEKGQIIARKMLRVGIFSLFGYLVFIAVVGAFFLYISTRQTKLSGSYNELVAQIQGFRDRETSMVLLKDRASTLILLRGKRNFSDALDIASNLVGSRKDVVINDVAATEQQIKLTITATDTFSLGHFVENTTKNTNLKVAALESITRFSDGSYVANLTLEIR